MKIFFRLLLKISQLSDSLEMLFFQNGPDNVCGILFIFFLLLNFLGGATPSS